MDEKSQLLNVNSEESILKEIVRKLQLNEFKVEPKVLSMPITEKILILRLTNLCSSIQILASDFSRTVSEIACIVSMRNEILIEWIKTTMNLSTESAKEIELLSAIEETLFEYFRRTDSVTINDSEFFLKAFEIKTFYGLETLKVTRRWINSFKQNLKKLMDMQLNQQIFNFYSVRTKDIFRDIQLLVSTGIVSEKKDLLRKPAVQKTYTRKHKTINEKTNIDVKIEEDNSALSLEERVNLSISLPMEIDEPATKKICVEVPILDHGVAVKEEINNDDQSVVMESTDLSSMMTTVKSENLISDDEKALECIVSLQEFAMIKGNFRAIGLLEQLELFFKALPTAGK